MFRKLIWLLPLAGLFLTNCATKKVIKITKTQKAIFLDSTAATVAILDDDKDKFFTKVGDLDMSIQMKRAYPPKTRTLKIKEDYKDFLRRDVVSFKKSERALVKKCLTRATLLCNKINPTIVPPEIELIKTKANHYGQGAYYTRENRIIIPFNALVTKGRSTSEVEDALTQTLLHEIFHIYSRYNADKRRQLYGLIGFKNIAGFPLAMDEPLKQRLLLNPDGIDMAQVMDLQSDSSKVSVVPIITANETQYNDAKPDFFSYVKFDLYQVVRGRGGIQVLSNDDGTSTIDLKSQRDFFRKIGDNTDYIIHPDEVLADNFMILALSQNDAKRIDKLSPDGKSLIRKIDEVLRLGAEAINP